MVEGMALFGPTRAAEIGRTGDDTPTPNLAAFVWRMSGRRQFVVIALALVLAGLSVAPLELKRIIINQAIESEDLDKLVTYGALFFGAVLLSGMLKFCLRLYQGWLSESAIRYCRLHLAKVRDKNHRSGDDGEAVSIIGSEVEQVGGFVGNGFSDPISQGGILLAISGYMLVVEPMLAAASLGFLLPQAVLAPLLQRKVNALVEERIGLLRGLSGQIVGHDDRDVLDEKYERSVREIYRNRMSFYCWKFMLKGLLNFLNALGPLVALTFGGWMVIQGQTSLGTIVAFMSGLERMADPLRQLIAYYRLAAQTGVKHDMIARWM